MPPRPTVASSAPAASMWGATCSSRVSVTRAPAITTVTTPTGRLKKNSQRQDA